MFHSDLCCTVIYVGHFLYTFVSSCMIYIFVMNINFLLTWQYQQKMFIQANLLANTFWFYEILYLVDFFKFIQKLGLCLTVYQNSSW